jgi:hypothetical protein
MARLRLLAAGSVLLLALLPARALAADVDDVSDQWLPRSDGASWTYSWHDTAYAPTRHTEQYKVQNRNRTLFRIRWDEVGAGQYALPSRGTMDFRQTDAGLVNLDYQSTQPPPEFPVLCASPTQCGNSLAGPLYMLIWGTRSPTVAEPLLRGTRWNSLGGAANDVSSANRYVGQGRVVVPAFPHGVNAAVVESEITQAGALGDPYGSGTRTVHWVRGVGPVRILFRHVGGEITLAELTKTNLRPKPLPSDTNLMPLNRGGRATFRWRNNRHMRRWSKQRFEVAEVVNNTARVSVKSLSGRIKVAGSYLFATRLSGITHLSGFTRARSLAKFPRLGPRGAPRSDRRHFFTPYDLMVYGFNPVVPVYAQKGDVWRSSRDSRDFKVFGVTGSSKVLGIRRVRTPAGRFRALAVTSRLKQRGYPFGSGRRTMYFAPNRGLVKLIFRHSDGSVSKVERLKR